MPGGMLNVGRSISIPAIYYFLEKNNNLVLMFCLGYVE